MKLVYKCRECGHPFVTDDYYEGVRITPSQSQMDVHIHGTYKRVSFIPRRSTNLNLMFLLQMLL